MTDDGQLDMLAGAPESAAAREELEKHDAKRAELEKRAPRGFDPAALFLLNLAPSNLYEPASARRDETRGRCKGCGAIVARTQWTKHHTDHKRRTK